MKEALHREREETHQSEAGLSEARKELNEIERACVEGEEKVKELERSTLSEAELLQVDEKGQQADEECKVLAKRLAALERDLDERRSLMEAREEARSKRSESGFQRVDQGSLSRRIEWLRSEIVRVQSEGSQAGGGSSPPVRTRSPRSEDGQSEDGTRSRMSFGGPPPLKRTKKRASRCLMSEPSTRR